MSDMCGSSWWRRVMQAPFSKLSTSLFLPLLKLHPALHNTARANKKAIKAARFLLVLSYVIFYSREITFLEKKSNYLLQDYTRLQARSREESIKSC